MKLKKVISVMLVGACVFSMAACGSKKEEAKPANSNQDKQLRNKISKLEEEIAIKEFDIKKIEEKIEQLSENGTYDAAIVEQLGKEKLALEKLMQDWESLQS